VRYKVSHGGNEYLEVEYGRGNIKKCIRPALLEWKMGTRFTVLVKFECMLHSLYSGQIRK
jgi:hypothetical protein